MTHHTPLAAALLIAFSCHAQAETMLLLGPGDSVIDTGTILCPEGLSCGRVEKLDAAFGRPVYQLSDRYTDLVVQGLNPHGTITPETEERSTDAGYLAGLRDGLTVDYCRILKTCRIVEAGNLPEWKLDVLLHEFER